MITSKYNASGIIEFPAIGWSQNINIAANTVQIITIPPEAEMLSDESVDETAVHVVTDVPSSVYIHQYHQFRSDASLVLPVPALGNNYYIMSYTPYEDQGELFPSEFAIVAVEDETDIEITTAANTQAGKLKSDKWKITLNKGQTYQVHGAGVDDDLTGTFVSAQKPIAIFSGNRWVQVPRGCGNRDNLLEQMPPIDSWGRDFVMVPTKNTTNDIFRILTATDNTVIEIYDKGNVLNQTLNLNKGNWRELRMDANARYVKSSQPILVAQFLVGGECNGHSKSGGSNSLGIGDPSMVLLNSVEQYRDTVTLYNSPYEQIIENYINIVMKAQDTSTFQLDGLPLKNYNAQFQTVGPKDNFAYAQIDVNSGPHTLIGGGCGVIAIAYGYGQAESYAYGGGANFTKINNLPLPDGGCLNDSIHFKSGLPENRYTVDWDFRNGIHSSLHNVTQVFNQLGTFPVTLKYTNLCLDKTDSITKDIFITLRRDLVASGDTTVCVGDSVFLYATDKINATYNWTGPNQFTSIEENPIIAGIALNQQGIYKVTGVLKGCASYPKEVKVDVKENPVPDLGRDTFFCTETGFITLNPGSFTRYVWQDGSGSFNYLVQKQGLYFVQVENEYNCVGYDSIFVSYKCPVSIFIPNAFSPNGDNINDFFRPVINNAITYKLEIFDRWGNLIFINNDPETGWNGRFNEQPMNSGVFVYVIQYSGYDEHGVLHQYVKSGDVTLIR